MGAAALRLIFVFVVLSLAGLLLGAVLPLGFLEFVLQLGFLLTALLFAATFLVPLALLVVGQDAGDALMSLILVFVADVVLLLISLGLNYAYKAKGGQVAANSCSPEPGEVSLLVLRILCEVGIG